MVEPLRLPLTQGHEVEDAKSALRKVIREHRRTRSPLELEAHAHALATQGLTAVGSARTVALYVATGSEPPTRRLLDELRARRVEILLPVLGPGLARQWALYRGADDLRDGAPGRPPEPSGEKLDADAISHAEVIITPGLAVDGFGNRLGQGGGWYDRMLKRINPAVPVFTAVFDEELVHTQELPHDDLDVPVNAVITPTQVFLLKGSHLERRMATALDHA